MKCDNREVELLRLLAQLEQAMKEAGIWSESAPSDLALQSREPFCVDTLSFESWMQFVMIPTFNRIVIENTPLPEQCDIGTMAEQALKNERKSHVIFVIRSIDKLLSVS